MIGTKLGHEITAHLGSVGMGEVLQTTTLTAGASVAIKFLLDARNPVSHHSAIPLELARRWKTVFDFPMLRLRTTFDDLLFVRTNRGLTPTQRALEVPGFSMCQAWHEVHRADLAHRWLRETIDSTAAAVAA